MMKFIKIYILPYVLYVAYRIYMLTVRYIEPPLPKTIKNSKKYIVAHFHQDELVLINTRINSNFFVMTSTSTDGEMMTRFLRLLGYYCVRGSSTRGGSKALLEMIHTLKISDYNAVIAVDGPKGPIYKVKQGALILSKQTGYPILPVGIKVSRCYHIQKSWNKVVIPRPFSKVEIKFGSAMKIPSNAKDEKIIEYTQKLEKILVNLKGL
ncbi:MAG: lysophospholipid acyltransferase family protein [Proteobacteria bacterium]|nr:lysophospholipid acyltransferase family protein [Pseudomonadota bacterium]